MLAFRLSNPHVTKVKEKIWWVDSFSHGQDTVGLISWVPELNTFCFSAYYGIYLDREALQQVAAYLEMLGIQYETAQSLGSASVIVDDSSRARGSITVFPGHRKI